MNSKSIHRLFLLGLLAGSVLLGCSRDSTSDTGTSPSATVPDDGVQHVDGKQDADGEFTHVFTVKTEYYLGGPQQARPPDGQFTAGVKVKLIEQAGSYSQVKSESGVTAFVAADAIKPLEDGTGN